MAAGPTDRQTDRHLLGLACRNFVLLKGEGHFSHVAVRESERAVAESHSRPGLIALNLHYHWRDRVCMATKVVLPISVGMAVCLRCFSIHSLSHSSPLYLPCLVYSGSLSGGATIVLLTVRRSPLTLSLSL